MNNVEIKIIRFFKTIEDFFGLIESLISSTYFKFNEYVEKKINTSQLKVFIASIVLGLATALTTALISYLFINEIYPNLGIFLLYFSGIFFSWLAMTFIQIWLRKYYLEFIVDAGVAIAYYPLILVSPSHEMQYFSVLIIWAAAWMCLLFTNSFYMMFKGKLEWD